MIDINIRIDQKQILNILLNILGSSLLAFGVCAFIAPFDFIVGGATGIALITHKLFGVNISMVTLIINAVVLIPGWIWGGKKLVLGSILSSFVYPAALAVFEQIPAITSIADSTMLAAFCGAVVCGSGIGLVMKSGGSTGGLDIPVLLIHKFLNLPVNAVMNCTDTCIMVAQIPFSPITGVLYGILYTYIMTTFLNKVLTMGTDRIKLSVISESWEEICRELTANDFGATLIEAEGGYTHTPIRKIESIMVSDHCRKAMKIIEAIDPAAFITTESVKDVRGQGYTMERIWIEME